ncbi:hypothetical protein ACFLWB_01895 [Chloroflexota bacterium]
MKKTLLIIGIVIVYLVLTGIPVSAENEEAKLTASDGAAYGYFGSSVSISEDTLVVGSVNDDDNGPASGSAYVFVRNEDDSWNQQAKLTASDGAARDGFGSSVSISEDTLVVGSYYDDDNGVESGSAYVFVRNEDDSWNQQAKLTASDGAEGDIFGVSVSISEDTIVVGSHLDDDNGPASGSAYVFLRKEDDSWNQQAKLTASDGSEGDKFGVSVSISEDTLVVGSYCDDDNGVQSGSAYVFVRNDDDSWSQQAKIIPSDGSILDHFGDNIAISGDTILANAPYDDDNGTNSGSVYAFMRSEDSSWSQRAKFTASDSHGFNGFGFSVAVCKDTILIGAPHDNDNGVSSGSVYVYQVLMNNPPVAYAGSDQIVEQESDVGTEITLDGLSSSDPDNDPLSFSWSAAGIIFNDSTSSAPSATFPPGTTTAMLIVSDGTVDSEPDYVDITVEDTTSPTINLIVSPDILWPPNHKMVRVTTVSTTDICDTNPTVDILVTHNEDANNNASVADGDTEPDWEIQADGSVLLRAEREGTGTDRIYTITVIATDDSGNESTATAIVTVPHDQGE